MTTGEPLVVVGDALLDRDVVGRSERLCPEAPAPVVDVESAGARPGGAALAALLAAGDGRPVALVTALGDDAAGTDVAAMLAAAGVAVVDLGLGGPTPEKTRVLAGTHLVARLDRGGRPSPAGPWSTMAGDAVASAAAVLVSDYGRGMARHPGLRRSLGELPSRVPVVWDPHQRGPEPIAGVRLATPNRTEAARFAAEVDGDGMAADAARARALAERWGAAAVAVTRGPEGALLWSGEGPPLAVPAPPATGDPCGAGDRFASSAAGLLAGGAVPSEAVVGAVEAAAAFVAAGGAGAVASWPSAGTTTAIPAPDGDHDAVALARRVRSAGGTVVAAGGCFDLLHAGHVRMLAAARALGDCLVVCLNSDASVRRLKGPRRPIVPARDRAAVLSGLACVDAVATFDEDTPVPLLERLRPHLFAKGGDYAGGDLPEAAALARWGGQVVVVPYLAGRSTTGLARARSTAASGRGGSTGRDA